MTRGRGIIPDDTALARMSAQELNKLANSFHNQEPAWPEHKIQQAMEWLADALLRVSGCRGVYSENPNSTRNRRICGREVSLDCIEGANWISLPVSEAAVRRLVRKAAEASCTRLQQEIWALVECGVAQAEIAVLYGLGQPEVSRILNRARQEIWDHIDKRGDVYRVYCEESHRSAYFAPHSPHLLPEWLDEPRRVIEDKLGVHTSIQQDAPKFVELRPDSGLENVDSRLTYIQARGRAKNLLKKK